MADQDKNPNVGTGPLPERYGDQSAGESQPQKQANNGESGKADQNETARRNEGKAGQDETDRADLDSLKQG